MNYLNINFSSSKDTMTTNRAGKDSLHLHLMKDSSRVKEILPSVVFGNMFKILDTHSFKKMKSNPLPLNVSWMI